MKKRINLRLILIAGIAVIVTMVCMTGIYYKLFQGQVRKDLQINARLLSGTGLFDDPDNTNVSLSEYYEVGEDLRVTWIAKDGTVLFDNDLDISQLPNHKNRPEVKKALFQGEGESVRRSDTMQMDNYYYALRLENGTVIRVATQARSVYSVFLAASPFVMLILILIVSICIVLAHFLTKQLLHPIERLAENMEDTIEEPVYKELVPFVNTIRKQHENILMAAKVRQDFTANVSHELKTPLTAMIGYADMLRSRKLDDEKHFLCANYIYTEGKRLETMALRLLDIIVTRRKEIDRKTTNVSGIFSYLQEIYDETKNPEDGRVKVDICWEKGELYAEENLLKTVLINLTDNAIKASEEGQTVEITGRRMENGYYFQVRDEGIGIPEEELQKITEAFYMVDKSRSRAHNGAGLGLALCTAILELHHSRLKVESTLGFGSCMSFLIPDEGVNADE